MQQPYPPVDLSTQWRADEKCVVVFLRSFGRVGSALSTHTFDMVCVKTRFN
jgi:hypothetical protein